MCKNTSIVKCMDCKSYECKNLYGPIKKDSICYKMIKDKLFDECVFIMPSQEGFSGCKYCDYLNCCSYLVRESVVFFEG